MKVITHIFSALTLTNVAFCANILYVDDIASPSHQNWNSKVVAGLLKKGHNVTSISPFIYNTINHENYTMLEIKGWLTSVDNNNVRNPEQTLSVLNNMKILYDFCAYSCQDTLASNALQTLLNYPEDFFDLIVIDVSCGGCLYPLIQKFNYPPTTGVVPFLLPSYVSEAWGNAVNPSFIPHLYLGVTDELSFYERVINYFYSNLDLLWSKYLFKPLLEDQVKKRFGEGTADLDIIENHISIVLSNIILGFHYPRPLTPNIITVGGLHIVSPKKLPEDLQKIIDDSEHGVVLFSLGNLVPTDQLNPDKVKMIIETLGRLKETVFVKMDQDFKSVPKNVVVRKNFPQNDILGHPKTKAFISHCGGLSSMEAVYYGVPVIGLPFFVDQYSNAVQIGKHKMGVSLEYKTLTAEIFYNTIQEVLSNPMYSQNARILSAIIKDETETPLERAIFWIEWVLRNNNTHLLDPKSRDLPLLITSSLDIHIFFLSLFAINILIIKKVSYIFKSFLVTDRSEKNKLKLN